VSLFKKYPLFCATIIVLLLLFVAGGVFIYLSVQRSAQAQDNLVRAERSLRTALSLSPAPTASNLLASEKNVKELQSVLKKQIAATEGRKSSLLEVKPPLSGTNMYYDLLAYKNELDKDAKTITPFNSDQRGVSVPEDFDWGFSRFLQAGEGNPPPDAAIPTVFRQKLILNYLVRKLLATGPQSIISVMREPVVVEKVSADDRKARRGREDNQSQLRKDEFWVGAESAAVPNAIETMGFKLEFTGYTLNLRQFLKDISAFELPLVVRSVEVRPAGRNAASAPTEMMREDIFEIFGSGSEASTPADSTAIIQDSQEPVVDQNISQFTVVIETLEVTVDAEEETQS